MYDFGPYQLDPAAVRLVKNGHEIEIEPQIYNTLLLLIENRERVVSKDELLTQIWHGRAVSDHVLTRTIYQLRKILDDKTQKNSHIRTVRGKGYQFIGEIIEYQPPNKTITQPTQSISTPERLTQHKRFGVMIGLVVLTIVSLVLINHSAEPVRSYNKVLAVAKQNIYPIVAVLPIEVEPGNESLSMLVQSLIEYLTNQLAVNLSMKVIHPDSLVHMGDQIDDIWAIQKATRSDYIIKGLIEAATDQSIKLHLTLYKNNEKGEMTPFPLGAFQFPYPQDVKALNDLYKQRKVTVRSIVQIIKPGVVVSDRGDSQTEDPEAYRLVIAAHHMSQNDDCKALQRAEQLLLNAVDIDDQFAYAYYQLFANYFKRVWLCGESIEFHQKALAMAEIVQRLAPDAYSPMAMGMNAILIESNQVEKAYVLFKDAEWNDPDAINHKNYGLRYAGFLNLASEHLDRILQLDPYYFSEKPINQAPNTLMYQNRFTEYMALLAEPGNSYHDYYRGLSLVLTDNKLEASKILQSVVDKKSAGLFDKLSQALLLIIEDDHSAAIEVIDSVVQQRHDKKHSDGEMTYKLAQLYALADAQELALKNLQISVNQGFFPMNYFLHDPAMKAIKNTELFTSVVEQATIRHEAFAEKFGLKSESKLGATLN